MKNILLTQFTVLLILFIYLVTITFSIKVYQDFNITIGLILVSLSIVLITVLGKVLYKKNKNVYNFLFTVFFLTGITVLCIRNYDIKYTSNYQVSDSILHYLGWINPINNDIETFVSIGLGTLTVIIPSTIMLCAFLIFPCYLFIGKSISKEEIEETV